jgi:hypothetical protein
MSLRPDSLVDVRKKRYKVVVDIIEALHKLEENMVQIQKSKHEESLLKKCREGVAAALNLTPQVAIIKRLKLQGFRVQRTKKLSF